MVEHPPHHPKIEGLIPAFAARTESNKWQILFLLENVHKHSIKLLIIQTINVKFSCCHVNV
jgi:hypothetical protein